MPVPVTLASDNFTRANENPLNPANWLVPATFAALQIVGNECEASGTASACGSLWKGAIPSAWPNDQWSQISIHANANNNSNYWSMVRCSADGANFYAVIIPGPVGGGPVTAQIFKNVASVFSSIQSFSISVNANDLIQLRAAGTTLSVFQNGVLVAGSTIVDSDVASGSPGLTSNCSGQNATDVQINGWQGGGFTSPVTTQAGAFLVGL